MALRDQPYLPLYVQDFMTDEKLIECSAAATGVYVRIMCLMHKSEHYGKVLLKQKDKQTGKQISDFALKIGKHLPYHLPEIESALEELVSEGVLTIDGDCLFQKRMVRDCEISIKRANAGKKGGRKNQSFATEFAKAKVKANTENEIEYENDNKYIEKGGVGGKEKTSIETFDIFRKKYPGIKRGLATEFKVLQKHKDWESVLHLLSPALEGQIQEHETKMSNGEFCPDWPHLQTWLNQRRWETELPEPSTQQESNFIPR